MSKNEVQDQAATHLPGVIEVAVGDRVGVLLQVYPKAALAGYGVYEGTHAPPAWIAEAGPVLKQMKELPRIRLDDGRIFWGGLCRWDTEETVQALVQGAPECTTHTESCEALVARTAATRNLDATEVPEPLQGITLKAFLALRELARSLGAHEDEIVELADRAVFTSQGIYNTLLDAKTSMLTEKYKEQTQEALTEE